MADESTILGVFIGGAFALLGTAIGGAISLWNARAERKERRFEYLRSGLEETAELSSKSVDWVVTIASCRTLDELRPHAVPAATRRLYILSVLYFPGLKEAVTEYHNALIEYHNLATDAVGSGIMTIGAEMARRGSYVQLGNKLRELRQRVDDAIAEAARIHAEA